MAYVGDIFARLAGRPSGCKLCGSALITIAGAGVMVSVCPSCDQTEGTQPAEAIPHAKLHFTLQPGCPECHEARRARA